MTDDNWILVDVTIMHKTQDAVLLSDGDVEEWVPKSRIDNWDMDWGAGDTVQVELEESYATERGLS